MKKAFLLFFLLCFSVANAQKSFTLHGSVQDAESGEKLSGVNILFPNLQTGTVTNSYGFYSIKLPAGEHQVLISYLGYLSQTENIRISENTERSFFLAPSSEALAEVVLTEDPEQNDITRPQMSVSSLEMSTIKKMPAIFGEVDPVKSLLLLPGISNAGEASSGFNVRGGAADQNLILLDEATVFNASHLFGLFSVFNPDAIKNLKLYKGGIPAEYGGRVSSVLEIFQKEGNLHQFEAQGGIGLISSRLLAQGPLVEEKSSFLLAGRSSYAHLFLKLADNENSAYFYDLNAKLNFKLDEKNSLFFSGYFGRDVFHINESFLNSYGNAIFNSRWSSVLNKNMFSTLSFIYSDYYYGLELDFVGFRWNSGIKNVNFKYDIEHYVDADLELRYGLQSTYFEFNPGKIEPNSKSSGIIPSQLTKKYAVENAVYLSAQQDLFKGFSAEYGLRLSNFLRLGQEELDVYLNDQPVLFNPTFEIYEEAEPSGSIVSSPREIQRKFYYLEPRMALAFSFGETEALKMSYNRMTQYLHLVTNTSSPTPLDVWAPSGKYLDPQVQDQVAVGFYRNLLGDHLYLEVESFYRFLKNRLDYIDGADLIANNAIEQVILAGTARAYGLEFLLRKRSGRFTGWLAYTLSRSEQRTPGRLPGEPGINNSRWYPTAYDKTHDFSFTGIYDLTKKWDLSMNFIYQTGLPTTYPSGQYRFENLTIPVYGARNSNRLPAYHRLDVAATFTPNVGKQKELISSWNFGIYNLYARRNAVSLTFRENEETRQNEAVRLSLFGIVPSITYNFRF